jgi:hypothetical protein
MSVVARLIGVFVMVLAVSAAQAQDRVPSERAMEALVKTSLLSFNDANVTGNYSVFHAKLSGPFRQQFSTERLKETFKDFSEKHIDFDVIAAYQAVYSPAPSIDSDGKLLVKGYFPTEPVRVNFELDFIPSDGDWKLIRIHVKLDSPPGSSDK